MLVAELFETNESRFTSLQRTKKKSFDIFIVQNSILRILNDKNLIELQVRGTKREINQQEIKS